MQLLLPPTLPVDSVLKWGQGTHSKSYVDSKLCMGSIYMDLKIPPFCSDIGSKSLEIDFQRMYTYS